MSEIYDVSWRGLKSRFLVSNPHDLIQSCFVRGHFFSLDELEDQLLYIKPNSIILDIGANVGNHTVFYAKYSQARIVVPFEVHPSAVELLRTNISLNHLPNVNLSYIGVGVGTQRGNLYMKDQIDDNLAATSFSTNPSSDADMISFEVDALDSMLSSNLHVDFVKIDVEGMEFEVLDGANNLIRRCKPIVFLECWGWVSGLRLLCWLVKSNYRIEKKHGPNYLVVPLTSEEHYPKDYTKELSWMAVESITECYNFVASERIAKLQHRFRTNPHLSYAFAEILLKLDQIQSAWKAIQAVEDTAKYGVVAWYQTKAELSEQRDDALSKLEALSEATELSPNDIQIVEQLSNAYLANGDEETAHSLMADFLNRNPHSAKGHHIMSVIAEQSGQITEALKHACMAAEFDSPEKPSFMVRFADLTRVYGESLVAALDIVNKAIRLGQTSDWAFQVKAAILDNLGNEPKS